MKNFFNSLRANMFKLFHSKLLILHLLTPVIGACVFCLYYSYSPWNEYNKVLVFIQAVAMAFPLMISISTTMFYEQELKAGNFQSILSSPYSKSISHLGSIVSLCFFGFLASMVTVLGFGMIFRIMGYVKLSMVIYLKLFLVVFLSNITLYILQYIICFTFGNGISLGFGILGTLLSPLIYLGLGDNIWQYIPCSYGIRISTYYFYKLVDINIYDSISKYFIVGIKICGFITITLLIVFIIWSNNWQANNINHKE